MKKILNIFTVILVIIFYAMVLSSCSVEEDLLEPVLPTLEIDGRLPMDDNGYYHLELNDSSNQTIHRVSGQVLYITSPTKIAWESNLYWNFDDNIVSVTNCCSYVGDEGEINTVIAPVYSMKNDTLVLQATINEWNITKRIKIVLD